MKILFLLVLFGIITSQGCISFRATEFEELGKVDSSRYVVGGFAKPKGWILNISGDEYFSFKMIRSGEMAYLIKGEILFGRKHEYVSSEAPSLVNRKE